MIRQTVAVVVHLALALAILGGLYSQHSERERQVESLRQTAHAERHETKQLEHTVQVQQELLTGIKRGDPFAVELLARQRLDHTLPGELSPPPLPKSPAGRD